MIEWVMANPMTVTVLGVFVAVMGGMVMVLLWESRRDRQEQIALSALRQHYAELDRLRREAATLRGEDSR